MPTLMLEIPQNPLPCDRESFLNSTDLDDHSTVLVKLPADPVAEEGLPPRTIVKLRFARFTERHPISQFNKKCYRVRCPVHDPWKNYRGEGEEVELEEVHLGPLFQSHKLDYLSDAELTLADRLVYPLRIRPCETRIRSGTMINSFMYRHETIGSAYEGAGWAFPTKTYHHALRTRIHSQDYEIICRSHLPPPSNPYASYILEESLDPNWQVPEEYQKARYYRRTEAPLQRDWNTAFDAHYRLAFHRNPAYKTQRRLQKIIKSAKSLDELDPIYQGLGARPLRREHRRAAQEGERRRRILRHC